MTWPHETNEEIIADTIGYIERMTPEQLEMFMLEIDLVLSETDDDILDDLFIRDIDDPLAADDPSDRYDDYDPDDDLPRLSQAEIVAAEEHVHRNYDAGRASLGDILAAAMGKKKT